MRPYGLLGIRNAIIKGNKAQRSTKSGLKMMIELDDNVIIMKS